MQTYVNGEIALRGDGKNRKCERCKLTTQNLGGICSSCFRSNAPRIGRWYAVVMRPSKLLCTFNRDRFGAPCGQIAVAVYHGSHGMNGKHACADHVQRLALRVHAGKDGGSGSGASHSNYKRGGAPSFAFAKRWRVKDAA